MKLFNNVISAFVVGVIFLIIIPLPTWLLDFMFIANLTLSFVILLTTMYIRRALEFSIYPSLLLITTLFRLSLNISSTRSILKNQGYAGEVVKTFGEFVIQGDVVVGLVIFLIIVLVQFLVITKGSERVAEVSARFTLDAMPGKQMAIDADLSSGLIDEETARQRRSDIQREADFFGSMDGASKFVKGDAIMSLVTTFINLVGGIIVGFITKVGDFGTILSVYSTATVGDGLMSQVPALLISVATGMIVTRSASENNLNEDVIHQFTSQPMVLIMASLAMVCLCFIGFPIPQVLTMSAMLMALGVVLMRSQQKKAVAAVEGPAIKEEVRGLLQQRDGLMCGICNGFQALVKLGLVPYGDIVETTAESPTLTYNVIGRHQSMLVRTRVASAKSPWFSRMAPEEVYTVAVSHGEGRCVCPEETALALAKNGQVATQYVDLSGAPTLDVRHNPNGSLFAIEGITSPDGRVLGKMAHLERSGKDLYRNVPGETYMPLFEGAADYFKL